MDSSTPSGAGPILPTPAPVVPIVIAPPQPAKPVSVTPPSVPSSVASPPAEVPTLVQPIPGAQGLSHPVMQRPVANNGPKVSMEWNGVTHTWKVLCEECGTVLSYVAGKGGHTGSPSQRAHAEAANHVTSHATGPKWTPQGWVNE